MFVVATSAEKDKGTGEPYDLTPALFENELDEPLEVKNFEIELVSSVIRKVNTITVTPFNNTLLFRLGDATLGEQYTAILQTGEYTVPQLTDEVARALNEATPFNHFRGWSCFVTGTTFTIRWTQPTKEPLTNISIIENSDFLSFGYDNYEINSTATTREYVQNYESFGEGNCPLMTTQQLDTDPNSVRHLASYRGLDVGKSSVEDVTTTSIDNIGVDEWDGDVIYDIKTTLVLTDHNVYVDPGASGVYLTIEGEYYGSVYEGEDGFIFTEVLQQYVGQASQQLNGLYVTQGPGNNDERGSPYDKGSLGVTFIADYVSTEGSIQNRIESFRTTYNGNIIFDSGGAIDIPNRAFQIDPDDSEGTAYSTLHFNGKSRQDLKLRITDSPLITGSHMHNSVNITTGNILNLGLPDFAGTVIKYKLNSIGRMNNRTFGESALLGSPQGRSPTGIYKTPVYKITEIDANGQPTKVILLDTGEYIGDVGSKGGLVLNDPNTFEIAQTGSATEAEIVVQLCAKVFPTPADIGNTGLTATSVKEYQILPTQVGLVNDLIHNQVTGPQGKRVEAAFDGLDPPANVDYSKDFTVKIKPLDVKNDEIEVEIHQFQPKAASFGNDENNIDFTDPQLIDQIPLVMRARSSSWNSLNFITGGAPANWVGFTLGVDTQVRVKFRADAVYGMLILMSFSLNGGGSFQQEQVVNLSNWLLDGYSRNRVYMQARLFPLHPVFSVYPQAMIGSLPTIQPIIISGNFTSYRKKIWLFGDQFRKYECNYLKNRDFMTAGAVQPNIFEPQAVIASWIGIQPQICIKTSSRNVTVVPDSTPLPLSPGEILESDYQPPNRATLGDLLNLESTYSARKQSSTIHNFVGAGAATTLPRISTTAVEITNLPLQGYIAKTFNVRDERIGVGGKYPIVGIIPSLEKATTTDPVIVFRYNTPYPQPVICKLATKTFLYNLAFRLRDIETGSIVKGLKNNTELIFRIKPLDDDDDTTK